MMKKLMVCAVLAVAALAACEGKKKPEVSFNTLEDARAQARANALFNAETYRAENPRFDASYKIVSHGDSTQTPDCPQGDGWATASIMKVEAKQVDKYVIKCSTASGSLGCYLESDFTKKPFASEEGHCQSVSKVPFPLPKVAK
jgi:hypothetical protein